MVRAFSRIVPTKGTFNRGVNLPIHGDYTTDQEITWWSFSSMTSNIAVLSNPQFLGKDGERVMFQIECEAYDISRYSAFPNEAELLLLPGTVLFVIACVDFGNGLYTVQLQQRESPSLFKLCGIKPAMAPEETPSASSPGHPRRVETYPDGSTYEGEFKGGVKCGRGVKKWPNGDLYEGKWEGEKR